MEMQSLNSHTILSKALKLTSVWRS